MKKILVYMSVLTLLGCGGVTYRGRNKDYVHRKGSDALLGFFRVYEKGKLGKSSKGLSLSKLAGKHLPGNNKEHRFKRMGLSFSNKLSIWLKETYNMKLKFNRAKTKKLDGGQMGAMADKHDNTLLKASAWLDQSSDSGAWYHPAGSILDFHLEGRAMLGNQFGWIPKRIKLGREKFMISGDVVLETTHKFVFRYGCRAYFKFRIIDSKGKIIFEGRSQGESSVKFFGGGIKRDFCERALDLAFANFKKVEEDTFTARIN